MIKNVHKKLTLLCTSITASILISFSLIFLFVSENSLKNTSFLSFQNDMNTLLSNLEQQTIITHEWLSKLEGNGKYSIRIFDNEKELLFNKSKGDSSSITYAWEYFKNSYSLESSPFGTSHKEFLLPSLNRGEGFYYASIGQSIRPQGELRICILSYPESLYFQIHRQRLLFLGINCAAIFTLFLFSWFFTKKLLLPIQKNRESQVQFIASASHELRTPLAVILSAASSIKKSEGFEKEVFLSIIQSEGKRMSRLIDDMLTLARTDSHSFSIRKNLFFIDTLVLNSFEAFETMAKEKGLCFFIELPNESIPPVSGDEERLAQVIEILLHNAFSYTQKGGTIVLSLSFNQSNYLLSVKDNGPGIPDSEKELIFERFYRRESSRNNKEHFGLGLCIAKELVTAHHGTIQVQDTPNGGSTFLVTIPLNK